MKKIVLSKIGNRMYFIGITLILMVMMSNCTQRLEGWKDLYLFNCSSDVVTLETSLTSIEKRMLGFYKTGSYESEPLDTIPLY